MKMLTFLIAGGFALALPAGAQTCTKYTAVVPIEIGDDTTDQLSPTRACVLPGGKVSWSLDYGDTDGKVTFTTSPGPLDPSNMNPYTDGTYYKVLSSAGSYTYQATYVDRKGASQTKTGYVEIGGTRALTASAAAKTGNCTEKSAAKSKLLAISIDSGKKLVLGDYAGSIDSICVWESGHVMWNADEGLIKAWTLVFKDENQIPTADIADWSVKEPKGWHALKCPGCDPQNHKFPSHKYQIVAIGMDGKVYRTDPDIIVVSDILLPK